ncbi:MAG: subtilase family N-terminal domain-containing protein [Anaerolineae bacterium]
MIFKGRGKMALGTVVIVLSVLLVSCSMVQRTSGEILIALKPEAITLLKEPQNPDPANTGISSLDSLNKKWDVRKMIPLFPKVPADDETATRYGLAGIYKLVVPGITDLASMVQEYRANPYIEYAEINQPYEAK